MTTTRRSPPRRNQGRRAKRKTAWWTDTFEAATLAAAVGSQAAFVTIDSSFHTAFTGWTFPVTVVRTHLTISPHNIPSDGDYPVWFQMNMQPEEMSNAGIFYDPRLDQGRPLMMAQRAWGGVATGHMRLEPIIMDIKAKRIVPLEHDVVLVAESGGMNGILTMDVLVRTLIMPT